MTERTALRNLPYEISISEDTITDILSNKVPPEIYQEATQLRIVLDTEQQNPNENASFSYFVNPDESTYSIVLYPTVTWNKYQQAREQARAIAEEESEDISLIDPLLYTNRLLSYLKKAPKERALAFADKLLLNAVNKELNEYLLHELKHLIDFSQGKYRFWFALEAWYNSSIADHMERTIQKWFGSGLLDKFYSIIDILDPSERSANDFSEKNIADPQYRRVVYISPPSNTV